MRSRSNFDTNSDKKIPNLIKKCGYKRGADMNCPKCQKEMGDFEISGQGYMVCENKKCEYYGIQRLDTEEFGFDDEDADEDTPESL